MTERAPYRRRVLRALSQLLNALTGGDEDETFSSRTGREAAAGRRLWIVIEFFIDGLFGERHCRESKGI
ncbi:MAG: hypothetical protein M3Q08_03615 [Pseudomonadota bacterium]|nr:hypothetical protein [Pseudomonadota bacterium]